MFHQNFISPTNYRVNYNRTFKRAHVNKQYQHLYDDDDYVRIPTLCTHQIPHQYKGNNVIIHFYVQI